MDLPTPRGHGRRAVLGSLALAAVGAPIMLTQGTAGAATAPALPALPAPADPAPLAPPTLVWAPAPSLQAFEGLEADRAGSHPGVPHIYMQGAVDRYDMHRRDRDGSDRQRTESKGMRVRRPDGSTFVVNMGLGERWRITYDMFMPGTLHGTSRFCHIFQLKQPGPGSGPLVTMSLRRSGGQEQIALRAFASGGDIGSTALGPLRNKWINVDMTFVIGDRDRGSARIILRDGATPVLDRTRDRIDIWLGAPGIRPKWGIYRSVQSAPADIIDTYILMRNYRGYRG